MLRILSPPLPETIPKPLGDYEDFLSAYLDYTSNTEVPAMFNRWSAIVGIGALLGRQYNFQHGHFTIQPNIYCMLIGSPGTRKSTAIKLLKKLLLQAGYSTFAPNKTSKEKFLSKLADIAGGAAGEDILDKNLFGPKSEDPVECFICSDEFNNFLGHGNIEFLSLLGELWDIEGAYENELKGSKSDFIPNPTISILSGNTPTGFSLAFPTDVLGQGFFSRLLLIYGEPNGRRITFPKTPDTGRTEEIIRTFRDIKSKIFGAATLSGNAEKLLDRIYKRSSTIDDVRFESYANRRFNHLIKLCLIVSASRKSCKIESRDVIYANTILSHTENFMPKALGEFGKARHAEVSHKIMQIVYGAEGVVTFQQIWKHISSDLEKQHDLGTLLQNLVAAEKLLSVPGGKGFLPKRKIVEHLEEGLIDMALLTQEEREMVI